MFGKKKKVPVFAYENGNAGPFIRVDDDNAIKDRQIKEYEKLLSNILEIYPELGVHSQDLFSLKYYNAFIRHFRVNDIALVAPALREKKELKNQKTLYKEAMDIYKKFRGEK